MARFSPFCCVRATEEHEHMVPRLLRDCWCNIFARRRIYFFMTGCHYYYPYRRHRGELVNVNPKVREFLYGHKEGTELLNILFRHGYLIKRRRCYKILNENIMNKFIDAFTQQYQEEYGIIEENIKDCSNSFVQLFTSFSEDEMFTAAVQNIQRSVQNLLTEKTKRISDEISKDQYNLLDLMFLPLFLTGFKCTVWVSEKLDISLYNKKCAVLMKLVFSEGNTAVDCLESIYKLNPLQRSGCKKIFDNGVEEYVVIVLSFNLDKKSVAVSCSHAEIMPQLCC